MHKGQPHIDISLPLFLFPFFSPSGIPMIGMLLHFILSCNSVKLCSYFLVFSCIAALPECFFLHCLLAQVDSTKAQESVKWTKTKEKGAVWDLEQQ